MHGKSKILYMRLYKTFLSTQKGLWLDNGRKHFSNSTKPISITLCRLILAKKIPLTSLTNHWDLRIFFNRLLFFLKIQSFLYQHLFLFVYKSYPRSRLLSSKRNQQPNSFQFSQGSELFSL